MVKSVHTARTQSQIPSAIAEAWTSALTVPHGPVWVEIPQDVLLAETAIPVVTGGDTFPEELPPRPELTAVAADLLTRAERPAIIAGGGVVRADAAKKLRQLAERLQAPVVTTFGGKGAFPWTHPLSLQSWLEDRHTTDFLEDADVLLVIGSGLGELSSNYHTFTPRGRVIQIEADLGKLESNHPALGIHAAPASPSRRCWRRWRSRARTRPPRNASARSWTRSAHASPPRNSPWSRTSWPPSARPSRPVPPPSGT